MSNLKDIDRSKAPAHMQRLPSVYLSRDARQSAGVYVERIKRPGEVRAPALSIWERGVYRSGDGDSMRQVPRAGSLDAFSLHEVNTELIAALKEMLDGENKSFRELCEQARAAIAKGETK